jgi:FkbM family methyltransferase
MGELEAFLSQHKPVFRKNLDKVQFLKKYNTGNNSIRKIADRIMSHAGKKLVLYGAGETGMLAFDWFMEYGIKADMFCDSYSSDKTLIVGRYELPVVKPNDLVAVGDSVDIVIANMMYIEILTHLDTLGLAGSVVGILAAGFSMIEVPEEKYSSCSTEIVRAYNILSDTKSREVFVNILNFRIHKDYSYILGIADDMSTQYFDEDIVAPVDEEVFVDCGACSGDTLMKFIEFSGKKYSRAVCFEPYEVLFRELLTYTERLGDDRITALMAGVYREKVRVGFAIIGNASSSIDVSSNYAIDAISLDEYFGCDKVTFIKMDIEGGEMDALEGAKSIIARDKPRLAISIYHKPDDLWRIPLHIKSILPEYNIYIRHYTQSHTETICYAHI